MRLQKQRKREQQEYAETVLAKEKWAEGRPRAWIVYECKLGWELNVLVAVPTGTTPDQGIDIQCLEWDGTRICLTGRDGEIPEHDILPTDTSWDDVEDYLAQSYAASVMTIA